MKLALIGVLLSAHREGLERALASSGGTHDVADVIDAIERGAAFPVIGDQCFAILEIVNFPRERQVNIWLMDGHRKAVETGLIGRIENFARGMGATKLTAVARRGLERAGILDVGFRATMTLFEKELTDGSQQHEHATADLHDVN